MTVVATLVSLSAVALVTAGPAGAATNAGCGFANPGTGTYASTLCWFDFSGYDPTAATSPAGQQMTIGLPGGYSMNFTVQIAGGPVQAAAFPTYGGAYLGQNGHYSGVSGKPALYQTQSGTSTTATFSNITVTDPGGRPASGFALVGADAESTDGSESLSWTSDVALTSINPLGNACAGGFTGAGTPSVTCVGKGSGTKTGTAMLAASNPTSFTMKMVGGGLEGFAFGVMITKIQLDKKVVGGFTGDDFTVSATDAAGTVVGRASTGASGATASTGQITVLTGTGGETFTLGESATAGTLSNYTQSWSCTRNGSPDTGVPPNSGVSVTVKLGIGDFEDCTISNTARPASLALVKHAGTPVDVNRDGLVDAGDTILYTFTVTNTGDLAMDNVAVNDPKVGAVTCPRTSLAPGARMTCTAAAPYPITAADVAAGGVDNTATASGVPDGTSDTVVSNKSSTHTPTATPRPTITLVKSGSPSDAAHFTPGRVITYSFVVTNTGNVPVSAVRVDETAFTGHGTLSPITCPPGTLAVGAQVVCTATYTVVTADVDANGIDNTAVATATSPDGGDVTSNPADFAIPAAQHPAIALVKTASPTTVSGAGRTVTYHFAVSNTGNVTLTDPRIDETSFSGAGSLSRIVCPTGSFVPGAVVICSATYTVTQADVHAGRITNSATASATDPTGSRVTSSPSSAVVVVQVASAPALALVKSATPTTVTRAGQAVTYRFTVSNTGDVTVTRVAVRETAFSGTGTLSRISCPAAPLAPGAQVTCTAGYVVTRADVAAGELTNTAVATASAPDGGIVTSPPASAVVRVRTPGPPLANTGNDARLQLTVAGFLLAAGGLLVLQGRRRRS